MRAGGGGGRGGGGGGGGRGGGGGTHDITYDIPSHRTVYSCTHRQKTFLGPSWSGTAFRKK